MYTLYRIEDEKGLGIYHSDSYYDYVDRLEDVIQKHNNLPTPHQERKLRTVFTDKHFLSFESLDQMRVWFSREDIHLYIEFGFRVVELVVSKCIKGDYQVLFCREDVLQSRDITYEMI